MASGSLTAGEDLWDERSLEEPEGAVLCERPALVLPLPHEEQIHRHGLTVLSSQNTTLEESQSTHREVKTLVTKKKKKKQLFLQMSDWFVSFRLHFWCTTARFYTLRCPPWAPKGILTSTLPSCRSILNPLSVYSDSLRAHPFTPILMPLSLSWPWTNGDRT